MTIFWAGMTVVMSGMLGYDLGHGETSWAFFDGLFLMLTVFNLARSM